MRGVVVGLLGGGLANGGNNDPSVVPGHLFCGFRSVEPAGPFPLLSAVKNEASLNRRPSLRLALGASATLS